jgi:hypothetical protein
MADRPIIKLSLTNAVFTQGQMSSDLANGRAFRQEFTFSRTPGGVEVKDGKATFWVPDANIRAIYFGEEKATDKKPTEKGGAK